MTYRPFSCRPKPISALTNRQRRLEKGYPKPESLELPIAASSPDQDYFQPWLVQHARLWVSLGVVLLALIGSISLNIVQAVRYQPVTRFVTFVGGLPVEITSEGMQIDGYTYSPQRLRAFVKTFVLYRYGYDWEHLDRLNEAIRLMSEQAVSIEGQKIRNLDVATRIYGTRAKYHLEIDLDNMDVVALGDGRFEVRVPGRASITDNIRHTDVAAPFIKPFAIRLVVATSRITENNPYGYVVVETGEDTVIE